MSKVFDHRQLLINCFNDAVFAKSMAELFVKNLPNDLEELKMNYHLKDREKLRFLLHRMKSGTLTLGALSITEMATDLEKMVMSETAFESLAMPFQELLSSLMQLRIEIALYFQIDLK